MAGREVREYTNLSDGKEKKWGSKGGGKDKTDDEDLAFKRMVAKMQDVAGERGGYLHGRGALDSDDLLYLKEQMEAEEDAERLRRRTEKRAFAAFKKAASLADSSPSVPVLQATMKADPKPRPGIRQQNLVKSIVEVKPKRDRIRLRSEVVSNAYARSESLNSDSSVEPTLAIEGDSRAETEALDKNEGKSGPKGSGILGLAYESSDDDDGSDSPANKHSPSEQAAVL